MLFHGSMLREPEIEAIAGTGASIIHNPDINGTNCGNCAYVPLHAEKTVSMSDSEAIRLPGRHVGHEADAHRAQHHAAG